MKDDTIYLEHIENSLKRIISYSSGVSEEVFMANNQLQDACIRQIEIIGEATKKISEDFRQKNSDIPWRFMAGMRDKLIHDYLDVDIKMVFLTITVDIPSLLTKVTKLLA